MSLVRKEENIIYFKNMHNFQPKQPIFPQKTPPQKHQTPLRQTFNPVHSYPYRPNNFNPPFLSPNNNFSTNNNFSRPFFPQNNFPRPFMNFPQQNAFPRNNMFPQLRPSFQNNQQNFFKPQNFAQQRPFFNKNQNFGQMTRRSNLNTKYPHGEPMDTSSGTTPVHQKRNFIAEDLYNQEVLQNNTVQISIPDNPYNFENYDHSEYYNEPNNYFELESNYYQSNNYDYNLGYSANLCNDHNYPENDVNTETTPENQNFTPTSPNTDKT